MIKLENYEVMGWEHAIRGMRNPMNSWEKSDSDYKCPYRAGGGCGNCTENMCMGPNDLKLMTTLANAGDDHSKALRFVDVYVDITAPLYWWKEFRTYRKGRSFMDDGDEFLDPDALDIHIETNSCSTMHKIHEKEFTMDDFSCEHLIDDITFNNSASCCYQPEQFGPSYVVTPNDVLKVIIDALNTNREAYLKTKDKKYWWQMIQLLPSSYNQKRTVKLNYQVLKNMYHARKNHKLDEWREFCEWIEKLPYSEIITGAEKED